jgi:hypothetical protein
MKELDEKVDIATHEMPPAAMLVCLSQYFRLNSRQEIPSIPSFMQYGSAIYTGSYDPKTKEIILYVRYNAHNEPVTHTYRFPSSRFENLVV